MKKVKKKECKNCGVMFTPKYSSVQMVCSALCAYQYAAKEREKKESKEWKERKKKMKRDLMTLQDYIKICQTHFNTYIRKRDEGQNCISCGKPPKKANAGHYKSVGAHPELRFNELNVHLQCEHCNTYLHGNLIEYRKNLINKIGLEAVEELEKEHPPAKYSKQEIKELTEIYKNKIKELGK